ncbi:hypothetical protein [Paenibacillus hexagrammi]|uniref:Uncharacterized protein n=1 Tax=Paenibacillus hexagrammi TaxID=2908839 RepID=A0ABY3SGM0_9BACL|nr:hypothetical protein [Paenibacillus sp. YPD9-1]UJF32245.1 hypothetical protein L0M14_21355 [Paenibacillus sp. YPD9-1]
MLDSNIKKLFFSMYWRNGWLDTPRVLEEEDLKLLRNNGLFADPEYLHHDIVIDRINTVILQYSPHVVGNYFLSSLSTRILEFRGVADCFSNLFPLAPHKHTGTGYCKTCGIPEFKNYDYNPTLFTIYKFGGGDSLFQMPNVFILEKFKNEKVPEPTFSDIGTMREILSVILSIQPEDGPSKLNSQLKQVIKSNDEERHLLIELMAKLGIIRPHGNLEEKYRKVPARSNWFGPDSIWTGKDSFNINAIKRYFPGYMNELGL